MQCHLQIVPKLAKQPIDIDKHVDLFYGAVRNTFLFSFLADRYHREIIQEISLISIAPLRYDYSHHLLNDVQPNRCRSHHHHCS